MLRYLSQGERPFGNYPMPVHLRPNWEFYAVVRGKLAPLFEAGRADELADDILWLFPPGCAHGWVGEAGQLCDVLVFHFSTVPAELEHRVPHTGGLGLSLSAEAKARLVRLETELRPHYWQPNAYSELHFERALMELSLLLLEGPTFAVATPPGEAGGKAAGRTQSPPVLERVLQAENWFRGHLPMRPSLEDVARACGLSSGHLRRLFHAVRQRSPREILEHIRMEHAMQLLAHSDRKLADVAAESGFAGASQFCQVFKNRNGMTPNFWRKHVYIQYQNPATSRASPHAILVQFGLRPDPEDRADAG